MTPEPSYVVIAALIQGGTRYELVCPKAAAGAVEAGLSTSTWVTPSVRISRDPWNTPSLKTE